MKFWTRELAGWLLIILGLFVFYRCYTLLTVEGTHYILEGGALTIMGVTLFRGGIQLLKVAVAARVCLQADERLEQKETVATVKSTPVRRVNQAFAGRRFP